MQISLADYSAYLHELRVSCTLFSNSVPPLNLTNSVNIVLIKVHTRCWSACKQGVVFLLFTLSSWCQMSWWTYRFPLTHNTELSIYRDISLYEKLSTPQNLPYLKQCEIPGEDCRLLPTIRCKWWNTATGFDISGSVFDPLLAVICFW